MCIRDRVYREFAYDDREVTSFGMLPEYADRVIIVDSVSKRHSACGARIGLLLCKNEEFMKNAMKIAQGRLCSSTVDQVGAAALFRLPKSYYDEVKKEYCGRRDVVYEELMKIPGVVCQKPGGAFYMTAKLPVDSVEDFLLFLLEEFEDNGETVMFAPAEGFYATPGLGKDEMLSLIHIYKPNGTYSIFVNSMKPSGDGAMAMAFEALKQKLEAEGLFSSEYKKEIPRFASHIGVITSGDGAAIEDIISTISNKNDRVKISIFPSLVQGRCV